MAAEDDQRETIRRNAKYAKIARITTYRRARHLLRGFITSDARDPRTLHGAIESWKDELGNPSLTAGQCEELKCCIDAVEGFLSNYNALRIASISTSRPPHQQSKMNIEGVQISAHLDALVHQTVRNEKRIGGIHLQLSIGKPEAKRESTKERRERAGLYTSALMFRHLATHFSHLGIPRYDLTTFVNVRQGSIYIAPEHYKAMFARVDAAARIIASVWNEIEPPADFDPFKAKFVN